jgi:hypothetical protein
MKVYLLAYEDGRDPVFRNVAIDPTEAGETPEETHGTTFTVLVF